MNKIAILALLAALSTSALANSVGFTGNSSAVKEGFSGPSISSTTVEMAKTFRDDTNVILRGKIERHLGGDNYLFRDATGTITVDIDNRKWNGLTVSPEDTIEISGEVDKDWNSIEIDVDRVVKVS